MRTLSLVGEGAKNHYVETEAAVTGFCQKANLIQVESQRTLVGGS